MGNSLQFCTFQAGTPGLLRASFGAMGRKWDVQPGCVLGMATFTSFSGSLKEQVMMVGRWG